MNERKKGRKNEREGRRKGKKINQLRRAVAQERVSGIAQRESRKERVCFFRRKH